MKALVKTKKGEPVPELREVDIPSPGKGEVLLKILAVGVCGTDIHVLHDRFPNWPPVALGHEFCGRVEELGEGVSDVNIGDRVVGEPHTKACGSCYFCKTGTIQLCPAKRSPGWGIDGAMAEYLVMPEKLLHKIPDSMSDEVGAIIEPTANAVHDVLERSKIEPGDLAVVIGPGPIGLLAAMTARAAGAREVIVVGRESSEVVKLPKAREMGFRVVNINRENPVEVVNRLTDSLGADIVIECSGSQGGITMSVQLVRKKGRICSIGLPSDQTLDFPYSQAAFKAIDFNFCLSTSYTSWERAINLVAGGHIPAGEIISHVEPLSNWKQVFDDVQNGKAIKAVLIP